MAGDKRRALFRCTHNSARGQMAQGLLRHLAGDRLERAPRVPVRSTGGLLHEYERTAA